MNVNNYLNEFKDAAEPYSRGNYGVIRYYSPTPSYVVAPTIINVNTGGGRRPRRDSTADRIGMGLISAIIIPIFAFLLVDGFRQCKEAKKLLKELKQFDTQTLNLNIAHDPRIVNISCTAKTLFTRNYASAITSTIFKVVVLAGAVMTLIAAMIAPPVFMAIGAGVALSGGILLFSKFIAEKTSSLNRFYADKIINNANDYLSNPQGLPHVNQNPQGFAPQPSFVFVQQPVQQPIYVYRHSAI